LEVGLEIVIGVEVVGRVEDVIEGGSLRVLKNGEVKNLAVNVRRR